MSLPKQVQEQLEAVEAFDKAILEEATAAAESQGQIADPAPEAVEEQPAPQPAPPAEPEAAKPEATPSEEETWQKRYKTLDGKYKAEVPRLFAEIRDLRDELTKAQSQLSELKDKPKAEPKPEQKLVTDEDVETFGSDLVDLIDRKAREVAAAMVGTEMAELKAENSQLREQLSGVTERQSSNDRRAFYTSLGQLVPDYEAINVDEGFIGWLSEVDPLSGMTRQDYLNNAYQSFDVQRTAALFNRYKELTAPPPPAPVPQPDTLQRQVAPGTSKVSTPAPQSASTKVFTTGEIERFYHDVTLGKFKGNEAEQVRIEAEIDLAVAEGRIR